MPSIGVRGPRWDILEEQEQATKQAERAKQVQDSLASSDKDLAAASQELGLKVWRIEDMKLVPVPEEMHGRFYEGDAYVVLYTWRKKQSSLLRYDLFFWLGKDSSADEQGAAAYLTVSMDDGVLGGAAVQHRETQGNETKMFLKILPGKTIEYLPGGSKSGLSHVSAAMMTIRDGGHGPVPPRDGRPTIPRDVASAAIDS